jgi:hypothetical protein
MPLMPLVVDRSQTAQLQVVDAATTETSGKFLSHDGQTFLL